VNTVMKLTLPQHLVNFLNNWAINYREVKIQNYFNFKNWHRNSCSDVVNFARSNADSLVWRR